MNFYLLTSTKHPPSVVYKIDDNGAFMDSEGNFIHNLKDYIVTEIPTQEVVPGDKVIRSDLEYEVTGVELQLVHYYRAKNNTHHEHLSPAIFFKKKP